MQSTNDASSLPSIPLALQYAVSEVGTREQPGKGDNPRVVEYHGSTRGGEAPDEVPWCASFVNWCCARAGWPTTGTKRARDWVERPPGGYKVVLGTIVGAQLGDIVVKSRGTNPRQGHVYFFFGHGSHQGHYGLGGNQNNEVNVQRYLDATVVGYLRYVGA